MKNLLFVSCFIGCFLTATGFLFAQQTIDQIRLLPFGSVVTTSGIVTTGSELGQIRYMQDQNAGIALYSPSLSGLVTGDSIIISGVLLNYKGELQISPVHSHQVVSSGHALPVAVTVDLSS